MYRNKYFIVAFPLLMIFAQLPSIGSEYLPRIDQRAEQTRTNQDFYTFTEFKSKYEWLQHKLDLKDNLRVSLGCFPWPEKTPLNVKIFDRIEGDGYSVEKAYFESLPGVYVTGNLYRPIGKPAPYPGIICPHGHAQEGRLTNSGEFSIPGRSINLARMGCVVFAYDMIGYVDSKQISHTFSGPSEWLWGLSLHGLQFWNSVRAVDFLQSLDGVDPDRIGCTGASGGGTQTYGLTALDERIKVSVPVNMISSHFQGGCLCENGPSLRLHSFNVEYGAMAAPRPLLMVSATGDWTDETLRVEYPAVKSIYSLYEAEDKVKTVQIDAPHNYNQQSREHVYAWFDRWFFDGDSDRLDETPFEVDTEALKIFPNGLADYPDNAIDENGLREYWIQESKSQLQQAYPNSELQLRTLKRRGATILTHAMGAQTPPANEIVVERIEREKTDTRMIERIAIGRRGVGERIDAWFAWPQDGKHLKDAVLILSDLPFESFNSDSDPLLKGLLDSGRAVMIANVYKPNALKPTRSPEEVSHFYTYNPSDTALRVQDSLTCLSYLESRADIDKISLVGIGNAGLWSLLAGVLHDGVDAIIANVSQFDLDSDEAYLQRLFVPHIQRAGGLQMAQAVIAPRPLFIHNTGEAFQTKWAKDAYNTLGKTDALKTQTQLAGNEEMLNWLLQN
ncbi:MAG: acetylxylan esterase [Candidatus Hinthialibacter antarcticus]|nr:acetylxylan esterase [Candidatus Hinthialibacter antarcticus]